MERSCGALLTQEMTRCAQCGRLARPENRTPVPRAVWEPRPPSPTHRPDLGMTRGSEPVRVFAPPQWETARMRAVARYATHVQGVRFEFLSSVHHLRVIRSSTGWQVNGYDKQFADRYTCVADAMIQIVSEERRRAIDRSSQLPIVVSDVEFDADLPVPRFCFQVRRDRKRDWWAFVVPGPGSQSSAPCEVPERALRLLAGRRYSTWQVCLSETVIKLAKMVQRPMFRFQLESLTPVRGLSLGGPSAEFALDPDDTAFEKHLHPYLQGYKERLVQEGWQDTSVKRRCWYDAVLRRRMPGTGSTDQRHGGPIGPGGGSLR